MAKYIYTFFLVFLAHIVSWSQSIGWTPGRADCVNASNTYYISGVTVTSWTITGNYRDLVVSADKRSITFTWNGAYTNASVRAQYTGGGCTTGTCSAITPTFNVYSIVTPSVSIQSTAVAVEYGTPVTFTAQPVNGGSSPTYQWYLNNVAVSGQTGAQYTNPVLQNGDNISVQLKSSVPCPSQTWVASSNFVITVSYKISSPTVLAVSIPYNTSTTLTASGAGTNEVYRWYDVASGGSYLAQGTSYGTPVLTNHKTYYVSKYNTSSGAESARKAQAITLTIPDPVVPVMSTNTCGEKTLTRATPPANTVWYWQGTNASGQSTGNSATTYVISEALDQTYYIRAKSSSVDIWSNPVGVKVTTDPVDLTVTNYQAQNNVIQATHSITLRPGFSVTAGNSLTARIIITSECNDPYNWSEQIAYNENNQPISRGRSYTNGWGDVLQQQSYDFATNKVFANQPLYDYLNNPSAATLGAPILAFDFLYKKKFITNASGQSYSANDFDRPVQNNSSGEINNPVPVGKGEGTLGWYYSSNNTLEPLTPTTNYPYSRSLIPAGPDPTTSKTAGPGDQYRMGANHEMNGERQSIAAGELNHYYTVRGLLNLPGGNPGSASSIGYKLISTDANGKKSVTFVDADGRTLASATLSGSTYDNWSYIFYNAVGQVVASVDPEGIDTFNTTALPPYIKYYTYDHLGQVIETKAPDEGITKFVYSKDGLLRFSQDAEQKVQSKFSYSNYDYLGRPVEIGEYTTSGTSPYVFNAHNDPSPGNNSVLKIVDNKLPYGITADSVTTTTYTGISKKLDTNRCKDHVYIVYDFPATDLPKGDAAHTLQTNVLGQVSRTKNETATTWYSYDEFGQLIWTVQQINGLAQVQTIDYTYDYFGNGTQVAYNKGKTGQFFHYYEYDADQRLTKVYTSVDGTTKKLEAQYYYYLHGPVKRIELGNKLQGIDFVYNIDGSLKMINHADPKADPGADGISGEHVSFLPDVFGETLDYNKNDYDGAGYQDVDFNLDTAYPDLFNGDIKSVRWHSPVDNHVPRAYAFTLDNLYQLDKAEWGNVSPVIPSPNGNSYSFTKSDIQAYQEDIGGYDKNGNILSLTRKGKTGALLSNYKYNYLSNTNKLSSITHNDSPFLSYTYNVIGQLVSQTEAGITTSVVYNAQGLVKEIKKGGNKLITYEYDDRGDRVIKTVYDPATPDKVISKNFYVYDVAGSVMAIYEQTVFPSGPITPIEIPIYAGGRIAVYKPTVTTTFYELSDHLGNVRGVIGNPSPVTFIATMEDNGQRLANGEPALTNPRGQESLYFKNIATTAKQDADMNSTEPRATCKYSSYLKWISGMVGEGPENKSVGPAISLKVESGDKVDIYTYAKYRKKTTYSRAGITGAIASILGSSYSGTAAGLDGVAKATQVFQNGLSIVTAGTTGNGNDAAAVPYAYLYYMLYDRSFNFITAGWKRVTSDAGFESPNEALSSHEKVVMPTVTITEPGYIYVFVSNESENTEVWFDDLTITNQRSTIVAGADYYPFGLPMENREILREDYRYGYQGQFSEKVKETGWNSFELRMYDARIGRWLSVDPYGQFPSPYTAMGNNPTISVDPDGGFCCDEPIILPAVTVTSAASMSVSGMAFAAFGGLTSSSRGGDFYDSRSAWGNGKYGMMIEPGGTPQITTYGPDANFADMTNRSSIPMQDIPEALKIKTIPNNHLLTAGPTGFFVDWSRSNNFIASFTYEIANNANLFSYFFTGPFRGQARNLDGSYATSRQKVEGFTQTAAALLPASKIKLAQSRSIGMQAHADFYKLLTSKGWQANTRRWYNGRLLGPDGISPDGRFFLELKPKTISGILKGKWQAKMYKKFTGMHGRVVYYDPKTGKLLLPF